MADVVLDVDTTSVERAVKRLTTLEKRYAILAKDPLRAAGSLKKLNTQIYNQERLLRQLEKQHIKAQRGVDAFGNANVFASKKMSRSSVVTQQFGYQISDFIVQVQSGQSAFIAFGQQATQLAGLLPPLAGLIVGVGVSLGTMVGQMIWATRSSDEVTTSFKNLRQATKELKQEIDQLSIDRIAKGLGVSQNVAMGIGLLDELEAKLESLQQKLEDTRGQGAGGIFQSIELRKQRDQIQSQIDSLQEMIDRVKELNQDSASLTGELVDAGREALALKNITDNITFRSAIANIGFLIGDLRTAAELSARIQSGITSNLYGGSPFAGALLPTSNELEIGLNANDRAGAGRAGQPPSARPLDLANDLLFGGPISSGGGGGGSSGPSPLEQLKEELEFRQKLIGKTEAQREVLESLGSEYVSSNDEAVQSLIRLAEATLESEKTFELQTQTMEMAMETMSDSMSSGFLDMIKGTQSVEESFRNMAVKILEMAAELAIINPILNSLFGGMRGFNPLPSFALFGNANGNAFLQGKVTAFANGGVVSSPTMFPMKSGTGLMGEAGPEAIMPLKRGRGGKLGVSVEGDVDSPVVVQNHFHFTATGDEGVKRIIAEQAPKIAEITERKILESRSRGGRFKRVFK